MANPPLILDIPPPNMESSDLLPNIVKYLNQNDEQLQNSVFNKIHNNEITTSHWYDNSDTLPCLQWPTFHNSYEIN